MPSEVSDEVTSAGAIRKSRVASPTSTWPIWSTTTTMTPSETSRKARVRPRASAASAGQKAA